MKATQSVINEIIANSSFLYERFSHGKSNENLSATSDRTNQLEDWLQIIAKGDQERFQKRLDWDNLKIEEITSFLNVDIMMNKTFKPEWTKTLTDLLDHAKTFTSVSLAPSSIEKGNPCPFEELLIPLLSFARHKFLKRLGRDLSSINSLTVGVVNEKAYLKLEYALMQKLFNTSANTFYHEFTLSRSFGHNLLNLLALKSENKASTKLYDDFVSKTLSDGYCSLFRKYPVLARFIAVTIDFWVEATAEFIERMNDDYDDINQVFWQRSGQELGQVIDVEVGISDLHRQHRSVILISFESGLRLVYKPKNLGIETAFCEFLNWCNLTSTETNDNSTLLPFKVLTILNKEDYGWIEFVEHRPCINEQAAKNFYIRAGQLLCVLYLLGATDCHSENLIASGEHLVLVDMETALQHEAKLIVNLNDTTAFATASTQLADSVLRTGLMPMWEFTTDQSAAYDLSGLGSVDNQQIPTPIMTWKAINNDDMHPAYEKIYKPLEANIPILNGEALSPSKYVDDLVFGFEKMYTLINQRKQYLKTDESPLSSFCSKEVRFIFRPTRIYAMLLGRVMTPDYLKHGLNWSIQIDVLCRSFLESEKKPLSWSILAEEIKALYQLDIPYFSAIVSSDDLSLGNNRLLNEYFRESCSSQILSRLECFGPQSLQQQRELIRLAFYAKDASILQQTKDSQNTALSDEDMALPNFTSEQLIAASEDLADEIVKQAITGTDDGYSWISLTYVMNAERFQLRPLGYSFYDGNCGIALFLSALAKVTGKAKYYDYALRSISQLRSYLQADHPENVEIDLGGGTGIGSIIYTLNRISKFLQLPELNAEALKIVPLITDSSIDLDKKYDIIGGASGAILGLLSLDNYQDVLPKAVACGWHLVEFCKAVFQPLQPNPKGLVGFSHGAAGIAYSLLRLYAVTKEEAFLTAARQAIIYENLLFYPEEGNWREITPIYNSSSPPVFWTTWCHGAPGIALGRLGCLSIDPMQQTLSDIDIGLNTTVNVEFQSIDHICCGNMGRAEIMLVASQKLQRPEWEENAQALGSRVVRHALRTGQYQLFSDLPGSVFNPSFFQGASGIGYHLLRLSQPSLLPSILLWE